MENEGGPYEVYETGSGRSVIVTTIEFATKVLLGFIKLPGVILKAVWTIKGPGGGYRAGIEIEEESQN